MSAERRAEAATTTRRKSHHRFRKIGEAARAVVKAAKSFCEPVDVGIDLHYYTPEERALKAEERQKRSKRGVVFDRHGDRHGGRYHFHPRNERIAARVGQWEAEERCREAGIPLEDDESTTARVTSSRRR
jgi:hypothetical protein